MVHTGLKPSYRNETLKLRQFMAKRKLITLICAFWLFILKDLLFLRMIEIKRNIIASLQDP